MNNIPKSKPLPCYSKLESRCVQKEVSNGSAITLTEWVRVHTPFRKQLSDPYAKWEKSPFQWRITLVLTDSYTQVCRLAAGSFGVKLTVCLQYGYDRVCLCTWTCCEGAENRQFQPSAKNSTPWLVRRSYQCTAALSHSQSARATWGASVLHMSMCVIWMTLKKSPLVFWNSFLPIIGPGSLTWKEITTKVH